jgi:hypothetical protein
MPDVDFIFFQCDDYTAYEEAKIILSDRNIKLLTLCDESERGHFTRVMRALPMEEIKLIFKKVLLAISILSESEYCITDYQSNVSRFIKLYHSNPDNVFTVEKRNEPNFKVLTPCPAYFF